MEDNNYNSYEEVVVISGSSAAANQGIIKK